MEDTKTLVIERERWLRGECDKSALLRTRDGKMCCLGFFGVACGVPPDALHDVASPEEIPGEENRWPSWLLQYIDERGHYRNTETCDELIVANDSLVMPEPEREASIASIFARRGVTVVFK